VLAPNIYLILQNISNDEPLKAYSESSPYIFSCMIYLLLIIAIKKINLLVLIFLPFLILMPLELFYTITYKIPSSSEIFGVISETNYTESISYATGLEKFWLPFFIINLITGCFIAYHLYRIPITPPLLKSKKTPTFILITSCFIFFFYNSTQGIDIITNGYPFGTPLRLHDFFLEKLNLTQQRDRIKDYTFNAKITNPKTEKEVFVLIIGETGKRERWSLNGYYKMTNPLLSKQTNLINFTDFLSVTSLTRTSVPTLLTRKPASLSNTFTFNEKSVISAFKEAGFKTYWLSMQIPLGAHDSTISTYAYEADIIKFFRYSDYSNTGEYDTKLLPYLNRILLDSDKRKFIVLHTLGSHFNYRDRYPKEFDVFKPSLYDIKNPSLHDYNQQVYLSNSYDNSVLFTDYFIDNIIDTLKKNKQNTFLLYSADHGESIFENNCHQSGHGLNTRKNFEIPAFAWYSDEYKSSNLSHVRSLIANKDKKINTENIFFSLLDAANIDYKGRRQEMSFASPYLQNRSRFINQSKLINYDNAYFVGQCEIVTDKPYHAK
jgi:glucan phosphoethanolaminetransferase (alkaline phosphatase superfamily)